MQKGWVKVPSPSELSKIAGEVKQPIKHALVRCKLPAWI